MWHTDKKSSAHVISSDIQGDLWALLSELLKKINTSPVLPIFKLLLTYIS